MEYLLECRNLWKWYPSPEGHLNVLKELDFSLSRGEFVAVVGASGVGKSTLLHVLGLLDLPSDGEMLFRGTPASELNSDTTARLRAQMVGFVFQFHHLLPEFTALENLLIPTMIVGTDGVEAQKRALEIMRELGIAARKDHFPAQLSGGEQQRVALARALINTPQLLLADEPTGNLDSHNADKFMEFVINIRKRSDITVVLATHNLRIAGYADRRLILTGGKLIAE